MPKPRVNCTEADCTEDFARNAELTRHLKEKHGLPLLCPFAHLGCSWKGAKRKQRLNDHLKKHHSVEPIMHLEVPEEFPTYAENIYATQNTHQRLGSPFSSRTDTGPISTFDPSYHIAHSPAAAIELSSPSSTGGSTIDYQASPHYPPSQWSPQVQSYNQHVGSEPVYYDGNDNKSKQGDFTLYNGSPDGGFYDCSGNGGYTSSFPR